MYWIKLFAETGCRGGKMAPECKVEYQNMKGNIPLGCVDAN